MSTNLLEAPAVNGHVPADPAVRTYRGRRLEELLPKIREELGAEAVVVRQREGLMGGVGGFFQQRFVEVDATPGFGRARIDVYDGAPAEPATDVPVPTPAATFALRLMAAAQQEAQAEPAAAAPPKRAAKRKPKPAAKRKPAGAKPKKPAAKRPAKRPAVAHDVDLAAALAARGLSAAFAEQLAGEARTHALPFTAGDARAAARATLARHIPTAAPLPAGGHAVAFVGAPGAGKTHAVAALAAAYAQAGEVPVVCLTLAPQDAGAELTRRLASHGVAVEVVKTPAAARRRMERAARTGALVVLDTPGVSPSDEAAVAARAQQLAALPLDATQLAMPAMLGAGAARELHDRMAPLTPSAIALTHADATDHLGAVVELACATRTPLGFVAGAPGLAPADPRALAERLLP